MKRLSAICALVCWATLAQDGRLMSGSGSSDAGSFSYETRVEPPGPPAPHVRGGLFVNEGFHRYMADHSQKKFFGYDIHIQPMPDGMLRVSFGPLSLSAARLELKDPESWSAMALPRYPAPQFVRSGDRIALDLLVNIASRQKIVDYLTIRAGRHDEPAAIVTGPPRDFTVEDAELAITQPEVSVNGELRQRMPNTLSGAVGVLYVPGHGRFLFSLAPNERFGFRKAGEVRGNLIRFEWETSRYQLACLDRVAPGLKPYNLYVFHDPKSYGAEIFLGSSDHPGFAPSR